MYNNEVSYDKLQVQCKTKECVEQYTALREVYRNCCTTLRCTETIIGNLKEELKNIL